jgi:RNA-directed DNA polymerase
MALERRGEPVQSADRDQPRSGMNQGQTTKPFNISKHAVWAAWKRVKANGGAAGIDDQSLIDFEADLSGQLYKLWNRMSSGSYVPPAVKRVDIPKADGGTRPLGIPTVADRVAQMVVKQAIEPALERHFHPDSYGYRPGRDAHQALAVTRQRCWKTKWVVDLDIKGFFDAIDHDLLNLALDKHVNERWQRLYLQRWLTAPVQYRDGTQEQRTQGTPQGGVVSPLLANLFLHYVFDRWMQRHWPTIPFARYADDIVCHCHSQAQAQAVMAALDARFTACKLRLHPDKTHLVYCPNGDGNPGHWPTTQFDFLGYTFRDRCVRLRTGKRVTGFTPAVSRKAMKRMGGQIKHWRVGKQVHRTVFELARAYRSTLQGWLNYYGRFTRSGLSALWWYFENRLVSWVRKKYHKRYRSAAQAARWLARVRQRYPGLFPHWGSMRC